MKLKITSLLLALLSVTLFSCEKDDDSVEITDLVVSVNARQATTDDFKQQSEGFGELGGLFGGLGDIVNDALEQVGGELDLDGVYVYEVTWNTQGDVEYNIDVEGSFKDFEISETKYILKESNLVAGTDQKVTIEVTNTDGEVITSASTTFQRKEAK